MSSVFCPQPMVSALVKRPRFQSVVVDAEEYLRELDIAPQPGESSQALRQCPISVRLAIASHCMWWFLARSHSAAVRTFAHAFMSACKSPSPILGAYHGNHGSGQSVLGALGSLTSRGIVPIMPYRVLHFFGTYLQNAGASGKDANLMNKKDWPSYSRPGVRGYSEYRQFSVDCAFGVVGKVDESEWWTMDNMGCLVRSSASRWNNFRHGMVAAMQPFFSGDLLDTRPFDRKPLLANSVPKLWIQKPRSKRLIAKIPMALAYGMEQVADEMPSMVLCVQEKYDYRARILKLVNDYIAAREEAALVAMAARDSISSWLAEYDLIAASEFAMPAVMPRQVSMTVSSVEFNAASQISQSFPGICDNTPA